MPVTSIAQDAHAKIVESRLAPDNGTIRAALHMLSTVQVMAEDRAELLNRLVFSRAGSPRSNPKKYRAFRRTLLLEESFSILSLFWKESGYVSDGVLASAQMQRSFAESEITAYSLATKLADNPTEVSAVNCRVRTVAVAAEAYGLLKTIQVHKTRKFIQGTQLLHDFMIEYAKLTKGRFQRISSLAKELD